MLRETSSDVRRWTELLQLAARDRGGKGQLLGMLHEQFNLRLPSRSSYARILKALQDANRETDFCRGVFGRPDFNESWVLYELSQGLAFFDMEDLRRVAGCLSESGSKWAYDKTNRAGVTRSIAENATREQFANCLNQLMSSGLLEPVVRQQGRWVVGPLGVTQSVRSRTVTEVEDLVRFIQVHFQDEHFDQFGKHNGCPLPISQFAIPEDRVLRRLSYLQLVLTHYNDPGILQQFNTMIYQGSLQVNNIERYWTLIATPCGVFKEDYGAEENLASIVQHYYSETDLAELLRTKGYQDANLPMGLKELCLSENPERLLSELFGRKELNQVAREKGLVAVERVRDSTDLVKIIALRLGFELPPTLDGIHTFITRLEERRLRLDRHKITTAERDGLMSESFVTVERILKDISYFYISFLWQETIEQHFDLEEKKKALNDVARRELRTTKREGLDRLMLGELIQVLRRLNEKAETDIEMKRRLQNTFERDTVVPDPLLSELEAVCNYRAYFVHDAVGGKNRGAINTGLCKKLLVDIINIAKTFADSQIYPCLLRINREVTDEYGRTYVEAADESGRPWVVKSTTWLRPQFAYFMHAPKGGVAVDPFITERIT